jgi:hypothetical protein
VRMCNWFPCCFFLTIVVVQNVPLRMTDMATGSDVPEGDVTPKGAPCKGALMRNRKLRIIRPSGTFSPEMTSSEMPLSGSLGRPRPITLSFSSPFTGYLPLSRHKRERLQ